MRKGDTMHELGLTRAVLQTVNDEVKRVGATKVNTIYLTVGYARDIVDELFENAFAYLSKGTPAEGAEVVIDRVPLMVRCKECGLEYHIELRDQRTWGCPKCGKRDYKIVSGMEFQIARIVVA